MLNELRRNKNAKAIQLPILLMP